MSSLQRVLVFELAHLAFSDYSLFKLTWYLEKEILRGKKQIKKRKSLAKEEGLSYYAGVRR